MSEGIAYQNMDIEFKILSESYKEKSFKAYGLNLPKIKEVLPTNLPRVAADEKRIDNLFLLEDGTLAIVDYESTDKLSNRIKYVNYIARVMEKYFKEASILPDIRMVVIYTGDIESSERTLETSSFILKTEQVFVIAGLLVSSDKFIENDYAENIRRWLGMTKVGRIIEQEKIDAVNAAIKKNTRDIAQRLFANGTDEISIMDATGYTKEEIKELRKTLVTTKFGVDD